MAGLLHALPARAQVPPEQVSGALPQGDGFSFVVWGGGSVDALRAAVSARGCLLVAVWITSGGVFVTYVYGAPAFVNVAFVAAFPAGAIPAQQPLAVVCRAPVPVSSAPLTAPLLQSSNLTYLGAFRLPVIPYGGARGATYGFDYAGAGFAFNPANNSLFISNHTYEKKIAEISIPTLSTDLGRLQAGSFLQDPSDITEGNIANVLAGGAPTRSPNLGGLMVYKNKLIGTAYENYEANGSARLTHFTSR